MGLAKKLGKKVGSTALNFVPGGSIVKGALSVGSKLIGRGGGRRRSRGLNVNKYVNRVVKAKMNAKLMKIKLSALKGI